MITIALGTEKFQFTRPIEWVLKAMNNNIISPDEPVFVQCGNTIFKELPKNFAVVPYLPYNDLVDKFRKADIIICHAGIGNFLDCVDLGRMPIIIPRDAKLHEHLDNHQFDFCEVAKVELKLPIAFTYNEFVEILNNYSPSATFPSYRLSLCEFLTNYVDKTS